MEKRYGKRSIREREARDELFREVGVNSPASRNFAAYNNITTYKGTSGTAPANLNWTRGNMLGGGNLRGQAFEYKYGPDNLRYSKKVDGTETVYYWDNDVLMGEKTGNNVTQYLYDASGIVGMIYNKNYYYFEKNLYGDVLRVYNSSGGLAASFTYDSYGNQLSASGSMADKVHFRYRGYYYDGETGFYYLQSRYYDPSICRFISADQYELVGALSDTVGQLNLYAYCNNNPIMYTDPSGQWIETVFDLLSLGASIVEVVINPVNPWAWAGLVGDAVDLLPFVTGVGESVRVTKMVKYTDDIIDASYDTIKFVKATDNVGDFADGGLDLVKGLDRTTDGFTISNRLDGIKIHKSFMGNGLIIPGTRLRVDGLNNITKSVFELKPYNMLGARRGVRQIVNYNNALSGGYKMIIVLY